MKRLQTLFEKPNAPSQKNFQPSKTLYISKKRESHISDYFDKSEIEVALSHMETIPQKLKLIDEVMQERRRIETRNRRSRIETMLPFITSPLKSKGIRGSVNTQNVQQDFRNIKNDPKILSFYKKLNLAKDIKQSQKTSFYLNTLISNSEDFERKSSSQSKTTLAPKGKFSFILSQKDLSLSKILKVNRSSPQNSSIKQFPSNSNFRQIKKRVLKRMNEGYKSNIMKVAKTEFNEQISKFEF